MPERQPPLFDDQISANRLTAMQWMADHPHVVAMFLAFAKQLLPKGKFFGINLLRERVRWECFYQYDDDTYKFCNTHSPYVARHLIYLLPELEPLLRCKRTQDELHLDHIVLITKKDIRESRRR